MWNKLVFIFIALFIIESCSTSTHSVLEKRKYRKGWYIHNKGNVSTASTPKKSQIVKSGKEYNHSRLATSSSKSKRTEPNFNKNENEQNSIANNSHERTIEATTKSSRRNQKKGKVLAVHKPETNNLIVKNKEFEKASMKKVVEGPILSPNKSMGYLSLLSLVAFIPFLFRAVKSTGEDEREKSSKYVYNEWKRYLGIIGLSFLLLVLLAAIFLGFLLLGYLWGDTVSLLLFIIFLIVVLVYLIIMAYVYFIFKLTRKEGDTQRIFSKKWFKILTIFFGVSFIIILLRGILGI